MRRFEIVFVAALGFVLLWGQSACSDDDSSASKDAALDSSVEGDASLQDGGVEGDAATDAGADSDGGTQWQGFVPGTSWQIQYSGTLNLSVPVQVFDLDLYDTPQEVIDGLHADGKKVICYFSAGSYEDWRPDAQLFPQEALGNDLDGWPGERWIDIRNDTVRSIMEQRIQLASTKHCDAVDPDNVDGYSNDTGFSLTAQDQLDFNMFLAERAHSFGMAVGLKNDLDQIPDLVSHFDFAVNEECFDYAECDSLKPFVDAGKAVFQIQYDGGMGRDIVCPVANTMNLDTLFKHMELDAWRDACR